LFLQLLQLLIAIIIQWFIVVIVVIEIVGVHATPFRLNTIGKPTGTIFHRQINQKGKGNQATQECAQRHEPHVPRIIAELHSLRAVALSISRFFA
jgi:hypothetical protein